MLPSVVFLNPCPPPPAEAILWQDIKSALDQIDNLADDMIEQWRVIGERLTQIRADNPGYRGGKFMQAIRKNGITLTGQQISAAQWWAKLPKTWRDKLHTEYPEVLTPTTMQNYCRDKYPDKARNDKPNTFHSVESKKSKGNAGKTIKPRKTATETDVVRTAIRQSVEEDETVVCREWAQRLNVSVDTIERALAAERARWDGIKEGARRAGNADPATPDPKLELSAARRKELAEEVHKEEVRAKRRERAEAASAKDDRPCVKQMETPIVMYGVQMWPITDADRLKLGYYDYDQLFFGINHFLAYKELLPSTEDHKSRGIRLSEGTKALYLFVTRRLQSPCKEEMLRLLEVVQTLSRLYAENPDGECCKPFDLVMHRN